MWIGPRGFTGGKKVGSTFKFCGVLREWTYVECPYVVYVQVCG